jgi:hypothetical protein
LLIRRGNTCAGSTPAYSATIEETTMADCKISKTVKYVLYLSEEEANFIKGLCQNSIMDIAKNTNPDMPESLQVKKMREGIFHAIHDTNFT